MARYANDVKAEVLYRGGTNPTQSFLVLSIIELILGLILIIWPMTSLTIICYVMGIGMLAAGAAGIYRSSQLRKEGFPGTVAMSSGIVLLCGGVFFMVFHNVVIAMVPIFFGIMLLVGAIYKLGGGLDLRALHVGAWPSVTITSILMMVLAIVLMCNPLESSALFTQFLGALLIINAAVDLWYLFALHRSLRR